MLANDVIYLGEECAEGLNEKEIDGVGLPLEHGKGEEQAVPVPLGRAGGRQPHRHALVKAGHELSGLLSGQLDASGVERAVDLVKAQRAQVLLCGDRQLQRYLDDLLEEGPARSLITTAVSFA
jgi:hypothetical protein